MSPLGRMVFPRAPPSGKPSSLGETFRHVTHTGMAYLYIANSIINISTGISQNHLLKYLSTCVSHLCMGNQVHHAYQELYNEASLLWQYLCAESMCWKCLKENWSSEANQQFSSNYCLTDFTFFRSFFLKNHRKICHKANPKDECIVELLIFSLSCLYVQVISKKPNFVIIVQCLFWKSIGGCKSHWNIGFKPPHVTGQIHCVVKFSKLLSKNVLF